MIHIESKEMLQETNRGTLIHLRVVPKARRSEIVGADGSELKIRIAAIPDKGQANTELIRFLADFFSVGKSAIELIRGEASRHKCVCMKEPPLGDIRQRLKQHL